MTIDNGADGTGVGQFDVERARRETPGAEGVVHLNNAGAALPPSVTSVKSARFDFEARGLSEMVRVSPHYYNTVEELERLYALVERMS